MIILSCDTFGHGLSLSLYQGATCLFSADRAVDLCSTEELSQFIDDFFVEKHIKRHTIQCIAFNSGPGNFTKTRVIAGIVLGISLALDIMVLPLLHTEILAYSVYQQRSLKNILVILDARLGKVYYALYSAVDRWTEVIAPTTLPEGQLFVPLPQQPDICIGAGLSVHADKLTEFDAIEWDASVSSHAISMGALAAWYVEHKPNALLSPENVSLLYLNNKVAMTQEEQQLLRTTDKDVL